MAHLKVPNYQPCGDEGVAIQFYTNLFSPEDCDGEGEQYSESPVGPDRHGRPLWRLLFPLRRRLLLFNNCGHAPADGLAVAFYQTFWTRMGERLICCFQRMPGLQDVSSELHKSCPLSAIQNGGSGTAQKPEACLTSLH